jgi:8-oxo-dGTP pyrophosphatase MutT (NUDIX family)
MIRTQSAGIVIIRYEQKKAKVLLMRAYNYWDFPKGGVEKEENKLMAAIREVK